MGTQPTYHKLERDIQFNETKMIPSVIGMDIDTIPMTLLTHQYQNLIPQLILINTTIG